MTKVIGLTGGIGSGKSTVAQFLKELGAMVIDADKIGHEAYKRDTEGWRETVAAFGKGILNQSGEIDRKKLAEIVFKDTEALSRLNRIMHPRMLDMIKARVEEYRRQGMKVVVVEAAVLIEANWTSIADEVWVTVAPEARVIERVKKQRGQADEQTLARIRSQLSREERLKHADVVISNDGNLDKLRAKVKEQWERLLKQGP